MRRASARVEGARSITIAIGLCVVLLTAGPALATTLAVLSSIPAAAPATDFTTASVDKNLSGA
jgi:hypothetical protein